MGHKIHIKKEYIFFKQNEIFEDKHNAPLMRFSMILIVFQFDRKEMAAKNPPTSLVPRLHVLHFVKVEAGNPLLQAINQADIDLVIKDKRPGNFFK